MELSPFLYGLYKAIKYVAFPFTWLSVSVAVLTVLSFLPDSPARKWGIRCLAVLCCCIIFLLGNPVLSTRLVAYLEEQHPPLDQQHHAPFDTLVVLAGGSLSKGSLRPVVEPSDLTLRRTLCGAELFSQGWAPRMLLSGGDGSVFKDGPVDAVIMQRLALQMGVPEGAITVEGRSRNTYEGALHTKRLLGSRSILVVTSAFHLPRALGLFKRQGFQRVQGYPCGFLSKDRTSAPWNFNPFSLIPTVGALSTSTTAINEMVGMAVYWGAGKL